MKHKFTVKQQRFIQFYDGNATKAAISAGYSEKTARAQGQRLLTDVYIKEAIDKRENKKVESKIATREERQAFWTQVYNDPNASMSDRLRASELLGKSQADFTENTNLNMKTNLPEHIKESRSRITNIPTVSNN